MGAGRFAQEPQKLSPIFGGFARRPRRRRCLSTTLVTCIEIALTGHVALAFVLTLVTMLLSKNVTMLLSKKLCNGI